MKIRGTAGHAKNAVCRSGAVASSSRMLLILAMVCCRPVAAVLQTLYMDVTVGEDASSSLYSEFVSQAFYGPLPSMDKGENPTLTLTTPPADNPLLCEKVDTAPSSLLSMEDSILIVPRGECTFETKTLNAQRLGAKAALIHGTLSARYSLNKTGHENQTDYPYTEKDILYPQKFYDYDCNKGRALIPANLIQLEPLPYNAQHNDPLLSGESSSSNLCLKNSPDQLMQCPSKACFLTGENTSDTTMMEACCAWDLHIWLYQDPSIQDENITIPTAYVTMEQGNRLLAQNRMGPVQIVLSARWRPSYNMSSMLIWALGVFVCALAAYVSASDYHQAIAKVLRQRELSRLDSGRESRRSNGASSSRPTHARQGPQPEEVLELTVWHALGFIVMASGSLLILFVFKIYSVVKIMYALGCSAAVSQVLLYPVVFSVMDPLRISDVVVWQTGTEDFGDIRISDIAAHVMGYSLGLAWAIMSFVVRDAENIAFFWITQNVFGACMCIMFMKVIRLNSIRVATILLVVAFFYDIFFVFVTPLLFKGKSVMITVATSGGPPKADASWCEKYPDDADCQGGDPLPMLLTFPRLFDYQGGSSLLGLGDIVLPGLLLSFAARFDAAKSLLGIMGGGSGSMVSYSCPEQKYFGHCSMCSGGYFVPLILAYAVGLLMANMAVYLMNMGQPALLYLVPCCLGTIIYIGWRKQELTGLWEGPRVLRAADAVIHGDGGGGNGGASSNGQNGAAAMAGDGQHAPLPTDESLDDGALAVPSAVDEPSSEETRSLS